ncbi:MAG: nucleotide exchange factor GrpE [Anaerolineae bacterium]|nr:nucleotide exchange factor GrpE [Anaerolineae bacterium]
MEGKPDSNQPAEIAPEAQPETVEEALRRELAQARREAAENRDLYLRALADKENARKRLERLYEERTAEAKRNLLRRVIAVADNLERALAHQEAREGLLEGIRLTYRQIQDLLRSEGVEPLQALGQPFNPAEHEAVALVEGPEPPGTVVAEELRGYRQGEHLLRPAHVRVTAGEPD